MKHGCSKGSRRTQKQKRIYTSWQMMRRRCFNSRHKSFKYYGGRGIQVCAQWDISFLTFYLDMEATWFPNALIDRIDNNGHYNRLNCKWSTPKESAGNRRKRSSMTIEEHKAHQRAYARKQYADPEWRVKHLAAQQTPRAKEMQRFRDLCKRLAKQQPKPTNSPRFSSAKVVK
jgi:hypothetical protein